MMLVAGCSAVERVEQEIPSVDGTAELLVQESLTVLEEGEPVQTSTQKLDRASP